MKTVQQQLEETYLLMRGILSEEDNRIITDILTLDEISKKTLGSYIKKASRDVSTSAFDAGTEIGKGKYDSEGRKRNSKLGVKRLIGISKATNRLTKEQKETIEAVLTELEQEEV